jgi:molecular chaperone GrpE
MSKPSKAREEPKLDVENLEKKSNLYQKQWPKDDSRVETTNEEKETEQDIAGVLEHPSYIELEKKLTEIEAKYWDQQLRHQAELDNVRRRAESDIANSRKYALEGFADDLLPVVDSLERALLIDVSGNEFAKKIHEGIELTRSLLLEKFKKYGITQVDPRGETFDPNLHQAIATKESDEASNTIIEVLQKGYLLKDRLIRPALVVVSK